MNYTILHRPSFALAEVSLTHGETLHAEPGSMVSKTDNVRLNTGTKGGILQSLRRAAFAGETFLVNNYTSEGPGTLTLAPTSPGDIEGIELSGDHLLLQSGAYIASSEHIETNAKWTGAKTFFTGEGLFLLRCTGYGIILASAYGAIHQVTLAPGEKYQVDTGHMVAFDESVTYNVTMPRSLKAAALSGEGLLCDLKGPGRIYMQTRNQEAYIHWLRQRLAPTK